MKAVWTAIKGGNSAALLERMGFVETGDIRLDTTGPQLLIMPSGWQVVLQYEWGDAKDPADLVDLGGEVLTGACNTISMASRLRGASWDIDYDCDRGDGEELQIHGAPPKVLASLVRKAEAEQADGDETVDYMWSVPLNLIQALSGFHLEEDLPEGTRAIGLRRNGPQGGFLGRLLGGLFGSKQ